MWQTCVNVIPSCINEKLNLSVLMEETGEDINWSRLIELVL